MGKNQSKLLKDINDDYTKEFSFNGKTFLCKILKILSSNRFKVVFLYKKKLVTWNVELIGCNFNNVVNNDYTKKQIDEYLKSLFFKNNYLATIICAELHNGFVKVIMKLKSEDKTLNDLMIDNGYSFTNINTSNDLLSNNIINDTYINNEPVSRIKLINVKPIDTTNYSEIYNFSEEDNETSIYDSFSDELNDVLRTRIIN